MIEHLVSLSLLHLSLIIFFLLFSARGKRGVTSLKIFSMEYLGLVTDNTSISTRSEINFIVLALVPVHMYPDINGKPLI